MPDSSDSLEQLTASVRDLASRVGTQAATLTGLGARLDSLDARLESAQAVGLHNADRIESVAAEHSEFARLEASVRHVREELLGAVARLETELRDSASAVSARHGRDFGLISAELRALAGQIEPLADLAAAVDAVGRRASADEARVARLEGRIAEVAAERTVIDGRVSLAERHFETLVDGLRDKVAAYSDELPGYRSQIEMQTETVREARAVADAMRAEAERIAGAHHATAEAERLFEARVVKALEDHRDQVESGWERFRHAQEQQWSALAGANADRDRQLARFSGELESVREAVDRTRSELVESRRVHLDAVVALRRDVAKGVAALRTAIGAAVGTIETGLPEDERSSAAPERREAVRKALRSRHAPDDDQR
jgi:chromosome segregation ATPase